MSWKKTGDTRQERWGMAGEQVEGAEDTRPLPSLPSTTRCQTLDMHKHVKYELATLTLLVSILLCTGEGHVLQGRGSHPEEHHATLPPPPSPQLDPSHSTDVTALADKTAILNCRVHNVNNKMVSWIRHRDIHLLTVGRYTYTSDQRFWVLHEDDSDDWLLKINYVQPRDTGVYECQVSTTPPMSHFVRLKVVKPQTQILGGPDLFLKTGSTINLTCLVEKSPEPPAYVFWSHNNQSISYNSSRGGVTVILEKGNLTSSSLLIQRAIPSDSGRYDCTPSNAAPANVTVHVLNGEYPSAMQHGGESTYINSCIGIIIFLLLILIAVQTSFK